MCRQTDKTNVLWAGTTRRSCSCMTPRKVRPLLSSPLPSGPPPHPRPVPSPGAFLRGAGSRAQAP